MKCKEHNLKDHQINLLLNLLIVATSYYITVGGHAFIQAVGRFVMENDLQVILKHVSMHLKAHDQLRFSYMLFFSLHKFSIDIKYLQCVLVRYDLTRLVIGSEGTLGVITEVTLRLQKIPQYSVVCTYWLLINFYSACCLQFYTLCPPPREGCSLFYSGFSKWMFTFLEVYKVSLSNYESHFESEFFV